MLLFRHLQDLVIRTVTEVYLYTLDDEKDTQFNGCVVTVLVARFETIFTI